jgi:hypothetical protein
MEQIGKALGITKMGASKCVHGALRELKSERISETELLVEEQELRFDALLNTYWTRALGGDEDAAALVLKVEAERRKMRGIDAPTKHALTTPEGDAVEAFQIVLVRPGDGGSSTGS